MKEFTYAVVVTTLALCVVNILLDITIRIISKMREKELDNFVKDMKCHKREDNRDEQR